MLNRAFAATFLGAALFFAPLAVSAFEVQPMRHSIYPANGQTTGLLTVKNTRSKSLPVELVVEKRVYDENGQYTQVPAEEDFIIFPFQALIEPGASQAFRFQYIGDPVLPEEVAYTISVREVPVDLEEGFTGLRYIYSFGVAVYVEDQNAESAVSVTEATREDEQLKIRLRNDGPSFARLTDDRITLRQGDREIELEGEALMSIIDGVVVPPTDSLLLTMNLDGLDLGPGDISVSLREMPD